MRHRKRGNVPELLEVDLYEVSPVLFGAHPDARIYSCKTGQPGGPGVDKVR